MICSVKTVVSQVCPQSPPLHPCSHSRQHQQPVKEKSQTHRSRSAMRSMKGSMKVSQDTERLRVISPGESTVDADTMMPCEGHVQDWCGLTSSSDSSPEDTTSPSSCVAPALDSVYTHQTSFSNACALCTQCEPSCLSQPYAFQSMPAPQAAAAVPWSP